MTARTRRRAGIALVVLTALLLAATAVCGYVRAALVDEHEFSARATSALENPDVRAVVAERVVDGLTRNVMPDALAVRPLVVPAVAALVNTSPFRRLFSRALSDRHRALVAGHTSIRFEIPLGQGVVSSRCGASRRGSRVGSRATSSQGAPARARPAPAARLPSPG